MMPVSAWVKLISPIGHPSSNSGKAVFFVVSNLSAPLLHFAKPETKE